MPGRQEGSSFGCAATLGGRGFEFSIRGARRVRILAAPRPWTPEGSSFPRGGAGGFEFRVRRIMDVRGFELSAQGPGGFKFSAILSPGALKGSSFRFPRRRRAACNSAEGFKFLVHRGRRVAEGFKFLVRERRRVHIYCPARKLEPFVPWAD